MLRCLTLILIFASIISCTNDDKSTSEPTASPELTIQANSGGCLDLEIIANQMEAPGFSFPGRVHTQNFEMITRPNSTAFAETLMARSFRVDNRKVRNLADFRGVKQNGCESITMPDAGGIPLNYRITSFTANDLELELDFDLAKEALDAISDEQSDVIKKFPAVRKYTIKAVNPTRVELISNYESVPIECPSVSSLSIREHLVYTWGANGAPDQTVYLDAAYYNKLLALSGVSPIGRPASSQDGLVQLDAGASGAILQALQVRPYAPCR